MMGDMTGFPEERDMLLDARPTTFLGPARVTETAGPRIRLDLPDGPAWALVALAFAYQVCEGDLVLAIGRPETDADVEGAAAYYVIGILRGSGKTTILAPGDLSIQARGSIELCATEGVRVKGRLVTIAAEKLETVAKHAMERFTSATRWVKEAFTIRAKRVTTTAEEDFRVDAKRFVAEAVEDVKIDGSKINLG